MDEDGEDGEDVMCRSCILLLLPLESHVHNNDYFICFNSGPSSVPTWIKIFVRFFLKIAHPPTARFF